MIFILATLPISCIKKKNVSCRYKHNFFSSKFKQNCYRGGFGATLTSDLKRTHDLNMFAKITIDKYSNVSTSIWCILAEVYV